MGRNITVYGIDYGAVKERLATEFRAEENRALLAAYAAESGLDADALLEVMSTDPRRMGLEEIDVVISAFSDLGELRGGFLDYRARAERMGELGIREIFETSATNPSGVFMDFFHDHFPGPETELRASDPHRHLLGREQWRGLLTRMVAVTGVIMEREEGDPVPPKVAISPELRAEAEAEYARQLAWRTEDPEAYSQKWGRDYFGFAWYCEWLAQLHASADAHDEIFIFDSY